MFVVLQWNARGVQKRSELLNFLYRRNMDVACIQESKLGPRSIFNPKGFSIERLDGEKPGLWGVLTLIKNGINYTRINVPSGVQAIHIVVDRPNATALNVVNVYAPPSMRLPIDYA